MTSTDTMTVDESTISPQTAAHIESLRELSLDDVMALSSARRMGLNDVFDLIADAGLASSEWYDVWKRSHDLVSTDLRNPINARERELLSRAADTASAAAVGMQMSLLLSQADHKRLTSPWDSFVGSKK